MNHEGVDAALAAWEPGVPVGRPVEQSMNVLEVLLRGVAAGAVLATAFAFMRTPGAGATRWTGPLFCVAVAAFAVHSGNAETRALGAVHGPVWLLSAGGTAYFWLFTVTLFEDRRLSWGLFAPAAVMTGIGIAAASLPRSVSEGVWIAHNLLEMVLVAHAALIVWRSGRGDLIEARRILRGPFMLLVAAYTVVLSVMEIAWQLGCRPASLPFVQAVMLVILTITGAAAFLRARPDLFAATVRRPAGDEGPVPVQDRPTLARLQGLMDEGQAWRREGLTIGQLAGEVGVPEHRLRRLINGALGFRNFADFVNARRIEAAKAALADPANARASVSALAFDLGYASLGPFNRAFKDATGQTPTAWRLQALTGSPPS